MIAFPKGKAIFLCPLLGPRLEMLRGNRSPGYFMNILFARPGERPSVKAREDFCAGLYGDILSKQKPGGTLAEWGAASRGRNVHEISGLESEQPAVLSRPPDLKRLWKNYETKNL